MVSMLFLMENAIFPMFFPLFYMVCPMVSKLPMITQD